MTTTFVECTCPVCQRTCWKGGMFAPGEAARAAQHMGLGEVDFVSRYLEPVPWTLPDRVVSVLHPKSMPFTWPNDGSAAWTPGEACVFFVEGRCAIHAVKPRECAEYSHTDPVAVTRARADRIAALWAGA